MKAKKKQGAAAKTVRNNLDCRDIFNGPDNEYFNIFGEFPADRNFSKILFYEQIQFGEANAQLTFRHAHTRIISFFLKVEQTPEVMAAGQRGLDFYRRIQNKEPSSPTYFPHLSLLYGNLTPTDKERIITDDLNGRREFDISFTVSKIQLWITTAKIPDWPKTWDENWRMIKEFSLGENGLCSKP